MLAAIAGWGLGRAVHLTAPGHRSSPRKRAQVFLSAKTPSRLQVSKPRCCSLSYPRIGSEQEGSPMNPNKALWEKVISRASPAACAKAARRWSTLRLKPGSGARPRLRRRHDRRAGGATRRGGPGRGHRAQPGRGGDRRPGAGAANCSFQEGDATNLTGSPTSDSISSSASSARCSRRGRGRRQRDGARDPARRADHHGQLDSQRSDAGRADPEDQLGLFSAAAGGLRQSHDLGRGSRSGGQVRGGRRA